MLSVPYPWLQPSYDTLYHALSAGRLAHALLFDGPQGAGKSAFAAWFAQVLLCGSYNHQGPCGQCKSCALFAHDTHPDLITVAPEGKLSVITVDKVRALHEFAHQTPQQGQARVIVIASADRLNSAASNALLKLLEAPGLGTYFLCTSDDAGHLLPTISSRLQRLTVKPLFDGALAAWLDQAGVPAQQQQVLWHFYPHGPLAVQSAHDTLALNLRDRVLAGLMPAADPIAVSQQCVEMGYGEVLFWLTHLVADCLRLAMGREADCANQDHLSAMTRIVSVAHWAHLTRYWDALMVWRQAASAPVSLNLQSVIEKCFITWQHCVMLGRDTCQYEAIL